MPNSTPISISASEEGRCGAAERAQEEEEEEEEEEPPSKMAAATMATILRGEWRRRRRGRLETAQLHSALTQHFHHPSHHPHTTLLALVLKEVEVGEGSYFFIVFLFCFSTPLDPPPLYCSALVQERKKETVPFPLLLLTTTTLCFAYIRTYIHNTPPPLVLFPIYYRQSIYVQTSVQALSREIHALFNSACIV
jgi:hypothetical protein